MRCIVGSKNPVKLEGVRKVLTGIYPDVIVEGVDWDWEVNQPIGMEQTVEGAVARAKMALEKGGGMGVGIESGLIEVPGTDTGYFDVHFCAIADMKGVTLGSSSGFEYPADVIKEVLGGLDIEEVFHKVKGIEKIGQKGGAVEYLSGGAVKRIDLIRECVQAALIPRLHRDYNK